MKICYDRLNRRTQLLLGMTLLLNSVWLSAATAGDKPVDIYNYHQIDERLATAGQVTPEQTQWLQSEGVEVVINLAVADEERNKEEAFHVAGKGITYINIPVDWNNPTSEDLAMFYSVMDASRDRKTLVHCFANYRASAFTYLWRTARGADADQAAADMAAIWDDDAWEKYPQWQKFVREQR
ncbi:MAG: protein tyrosine phosphatase family protein [Pseudomonadales bacterium]|nr:protein tyrosine phosphatase family protein [Pseudomonadales bacterium]